MRMSVNMRMNSIINQKIKEFRLEVRKEYKFNLKYPNNKPMESRLDEKYEYYRGYFNGMVWCPDITYNQMAVANKKLTYEYFRLKSIYVSNCSSLVTLEFLKQVIR